MSLPEVREWSETLPDVQEALPGVREALPDMWEWSEGPPGCSGVVGRPSRMSGSGREAFQDVREWTGGPPGCP